MIEKYVLNKPVLFSFNPIDKLTQSEKIEQSPELAPCQLKLWTNDSDSPLITAHSV